MRQILVIPVLLLLIGCRTSAPTRAATDGPANAALIEDLFAAYADYFPEAKRVPAPKNPHDYFAGIYQDGRPSNRGFDGRILYLFPDATCIVTDWTDVSDEWIVASGAWRYERGCLEITFFWPAAPPMDATYVPLQFSDSTRNQLALLGSPKGLRSFKSWQIEVGAEIRSARIRYDADARMRKDFEYTNQAEELIYISFFHSTYSRGTVFQDLDWKPIKQRLLSRRLPDGSKVPIGGGPGD